jgi:uncharacterized membrane protein
MPEQAAEPAREQWMLKRNCAMSPAQLAACFSVLGLVSVLIAGVWAMQGAWPIIVFALVEWLALAVAFVAYGRHAGDYERIVLSSDRILIERASAHRLQRSELNPGWLRVEYQEGQRGPVRLVQGDKALTVGRFLVQEQRRRLAKELRLSLAAINRA